MSKGNCNYCGDPPSCTMYNRNKSDFYIYNGIDRVDNNVGYVLDNAVSCCKVCNRAKYNMAEEEFLSWTERLGKFRKTSEALDNISYLVAELG